MDIWSKEGVLTMPASGKKYVVDCVSGRLVLKSSARWIGWSKKHGGPFWIALDADINSALVLYPSKPKSEVVHEKVK